MPSFAQSVLSAARAAAPVAYRVATVVSVEDGTCTIEIDGEVFSEIHWNIPPGGSVAAPLVGSVVNLLLAQGQILILGSSSLPTGG